MLKSVEWHQNSLVNIKLHVERLERERAALQRKIAAANEAAYALEVKIITAMAGGQTHFCSPSYLLSGGQMQQEHVTHG